MKQNELKDLELNDRITFNWKGKTYTSIVNDIDYRNGKIKIYTGIYVGYVHIAIIITPENIISFEHIKE